MVVPRTLRFAAFSLLVLVLPLAHRAYAQPKIADEALKEAQSRGAIPKDSGIDLEHGRDVVMGRAKCMSGECKPCYQCHRIEGQGSPALPSPRLAGQSYRYLYAALEDFASGRRRNDVMTPIAKALTPDAWRDAAAFYSLQKVQGPDLSALAQASHKTIAGSLQRGALIANEGLDKRGVQACVNCHGPQGAGLPPAYPYLAGQYADYLETRLEAWKEGKVRSDAYASGIMEDIARRLTEEDIRAVSEYFFAISPPRIVRDKSLGGPLKLGQK